MLKLEYKDVPAHWPVCINEKCRRRKNCLRYMAAQVIPENVQSAKCLMPHVLKSVPCEFYVEPKVLHFAQGFGDLFGKVTVADSPLLRRKIMRYLGSRSAFYRFKNGERLLTPTQQKWISDLFRQHGYTHKIQYTKYIDAFDFSV